MAEAPDRKEAESSLQVYIEASGDKAPYKWLCDNFPGIPTATAYRMIKRCQDRVAAATDAQKQKEQEAARALGAQLPQPISPAVVARSDPAEVAKSVDFMMLYHDCVEDAYIIRESLRVKKDDGNFRVTNPVMMDRNIGRRLDLMKGYLQAMEAIYNQDRTREMYAIIVDEVGNVSPDVQRRILERLREANKRLGFTLDVSRL